MKEIITISIILLFVLAEYGKDKQPTKLDIKMIKMQMNRLSCDK